MTKNRTILLSSKEDWPRQARFAWVTNTGNVTDDCFSSLSAPCSLTDMQPYIRVHENSHVQNGSDIWSWIQVLQNSLVLRRGKGWDFAQSNADFLVLLSLLDDRSPQATRTSHDDDRWFFCARSRPRPEVKFNSNFRRTVVDYHTLRAPITAQLSPTLRWAKRVKKKERWRACADKDRSKKEHRTQDESDLCRHDNRPL